MYRRTYGVMNASASIEKWCCWFDRFDHKLYDTREELEVLVQRPLILVFRTFNWYRLSLDVDSLFERNWSIGAFREAE